jgi:hypothetical protein
VQGEFCNHCSIGTDKWPAKRFAVFNAGAPPFEKRRLNDQHSGPHYRDEISVRNLAKKMDRSSHVFFSGFLKELWQRFVLGIRVIS